MSENGELKIFTFPAPVLREKAELVTDIDASLEDLADRMIATMYGAPGIGLAANQVGALKRLIVVDLDPKKPGKNPQVLINPVIVQREDKIVHNEACLSVLDFSADVERSAKVRVSGVDRKGKPVEIDAEGLLAVCLQHEIDHLDGILYIDYLSSLKRAIYKRRLKKILAGE
jgi:peptide deformylase